ncbi:hypothetical protein LZC95_36465 [Pendulispora brunnea]|uniref:Uncharacterized protein n=1 Tax=Pendulispora brunnea TaxID=2905690 RepID=A0ABZ2JZL3_9BACT
MKWRYGIGLAALSFAAWIFSACSGDDSNGSGPPSGQDGGNDAFLSDAGADSDPGNAAAACENYCRIVGEHCQGEVRNQPKGEPTAQYLSNEGCRHACSKMDLGQPSDENGVDSIYCRIWHADAPAQGDPGKHCPHAGLSGGGTCSGAVDSGASGRCATFCHLALAICDPAALKAAGVPPTDVPFQDEGACLNACGKDLGTGGNTPAFNFDSSQNELTQRGDTLNCRQYQLGVAYDDPPLADGGVTESAKRVCPWLRANGGLTPPPDGGPCVGTK